MSVNKVILIGNVGREPDVRYIDNNRAVANFTLATTERGYKLNNGTEVPERTEWHRIVVFGNMAKVVENYVHKGTQVYVEGKLQSRNWTDKEGKERSTVEIVADSMQLLGRKGDNQQSSPQYDSRKQGGQDPIGGADSSIAADDDLPF